MATIQPPENAATTVPLSIDRLTPGNDPIQWPADAVATGHRESPSELASAISNAAEKLTQRDSNSLSASEAAGLVKADLHILGMIGKDQVDARHSAAAALAEIAEHHAAYRDELTRQDPVVSQEAQTAHQEDLRRTWDKEVRKGAELAPLPASAGMTSALDSKGVTYLIELNQPAVHMVSQDGQRVVVGQSEKGKGLFMTRDDGHFDVVGTTKEAIESFIDSRRLYPLESAAISMMATENGIYENISFARKAPGEKAPLAVEIQTSRGDRGYAVAVTGDNGEPGVQFQWGPTTHSEVYSSIGQLELAGLAAQLRPNAIGDAIELAQVMGVPGRPFELDYDASALGRKDLWQRIESVPETFMRANFESGMAEIKEEGVITPVSGLAAIERWSNEHDATPVDQERLVALDLEATRGRNAAAERDPSEQLERIQLEGPAQRIGMTMPKPDWMETIQLLKASDPGVPSKVYIPKAGQEYGGQLLMVTDTHAIQRIGKGVAVAHDLSKMSNRASIYADMDASRIRRGMDMKVTYGQDAGSARFFTIDPAQAKTMQRDLAAWAEKNITNPRAREVYLKHVASATLETAKPRDTPLQRLVPTQAPARDTQISR